MIRQNLLPILRKWKIWLAVFLAAAAFTVSGAWLSREVARNQAEIDRTWEEMTVNFRLGPGRKSLSSTFTLKFAQVRKLIELDFYESFDLDMTVPKGYAFVSNRHPVVDLENGTVESPAPWSGRPVPGTNTGRSRNGARAAKWRSPQLWPNTSGSKRAAF